MTKEIYINVNCPKCNNPQILKLYKSINVTLNPELKDELFAENINLFECLKCDFKSIYPSHLFYHDMDRKYIVYYLPFDLEQLFHSNDFTDDGELKFDSSIPNISDYLLHGHIVFDYTELLRYVTFRDVLYNINNQNKT